jgi:hypothetical protein
MRNIPGMSAASILYGVGLPYEAVVRALIAEVGLTYEEATRAATQQLPFSVTQPR